MGAGPDELEAFMTTEEDGDKKQRQSHPLSKLGIKLFDARESA